MFGERLAEARKRAGLYQIDLAIALGDRYSQGMISHVETGRSLMALDGVAKVAEELSVSVDYLLGLTDDPTPVARLHLQLKEVESLLLQARSEGRSTEEVLDDLDNWRPVDVVEVAAAAGAGAEVLDETPVGRSWFSRTWLRENALDPVQCAVLAVRGGSMEPTLPDGCSILVDRNRRVLQTNRIYVLRTCDGLVVKRVLWVNGWLIFSDNPSWLPVPLEEDTDVVGEVRWTSRTL